VPLRAAFLLPDKRLMPLFTEAGRFNPEIAEMGESAREEKERWRGRGGRGV
jgi:hypothetical protein